VLLVFDLTKHNRYKNGNTDRKNTPYFPTTNIDVILFCSWSSKWTLSRCSDVQHVITSFISLSEQH
jgi:hypothetical protein